MYQIIIVTIPAGTTHPNVNEMTTSTAPTKSTATTKSTSTTESTSTSSTFINNGDQTSSASTMTDDTRQLIGIRNW